MLHRLLPVRHRYSCNHKTVLPSAVSHRNTAEPQSLLCKKNLLYRNRLLPAHRLPPAHLHTPDMLPALPLRCHIPAAHQPEWSLHLPLPVHPDNSDMPHLPAPVHRFRSHKILPLSAEPRKTDPHRMLLPRSPVLPVYPGTPATADSVCLPLPSAVQGSPSTAGPDVPAPHPASLPSHNTYHSLRSKHSHSRKHRCQGQPSSSLLRMLQLQADRSCTRYRSPQNPHLAGNVPSGHRNKPLPHYNQLLSQSPLPVHPSQNTLHLHNPSHCRTVLYTIHQSHRGL